MRPTIVVPDTDPWSNAKLRRASRQAEQTDRRMRAAATDSARAALPAFDYYLDLRGFERARRVPILRPPRLYRYRPNSQR